MYARLDSDGLGCATYLDENSTGLGHAAAEDLSLLCATFARLHSDEGLGGATFLDKDDSIGLGHAAAEEDLWPCTGEHISTVCCRAATRRGVKIRRFARDDVGGVSV
jgi:hypothetical protein